MANGRTKWKAFLWNDDGIGTLEIILIVAIIVIIAVAFRKWIIAWVEKLFQESNDELIETNENTVSIPEVP